MAGVAGRWDSVTAAGPVTVMKRHSPSRRGTMRRPAWSTYRQALALLMHGATVRVGGRVALAVGTILSAANQGTVIAEGHSSWVTWVRVAVNYATPFVVASLGYLAGCRTRTEPDPDNEGQP